MVKEVKNNTELNKRMVDEDSGHLNKIFRKRLDEVILTGKLKKKAHHCCGGINW